jgi:hypothetical protein
MEYMYVYIYIHILYNIMGTLPLLITSCTCYAIEDAVRIVNLFIYNLHVRNYNHSQLFITLCHICTAYNLTLQYFILFVIQSS